MSKIITIRDLIRSDREYGLRIDFNTEEKNQVIKSEVRLADRVPEYLLIAEINAATNKLVFLSEDLNLKISGHFKDQYLQELIAIEEDYMFIPFEEVLDNAVSASH